MHFQHLLVLALCLVVNGHVVEGVGHLKVFTPKAFEFVVKSEKSEHIFHFLSFITVSRTALCTIPTP